jgi:hypothetical protein
MAHIGISAALQLPGNRQQRLQLLRDGRILKIALHVEHQLFITPEMTSGQSPMSSLTVVTIVSRGYVRDDQFAFARRQCAGCMQ